MTDAINRRKFLHLVGATAAVTPLLSHSALSNEVLSDRGVMTPAPSPQEALEKYFAGTQWSKEVTDPYLHESAVDSVRAKHREILAKWYNSKIDTLVFRGLTNGRL